MKISWEPFHVRTAHPFRISRGVKTGDDLVWVRLEHEGIEGWGEADPSGYYGETADTVEAALRKLAPRIEEVEDPFALENIERDLAALLGRTGRRAARSRPHFTTGWGNASGSRCGSSGVWIPRTPR